MTLIRAFTKLAICDQNRPTLLDVGKSVLLATVHPTHFCKELGHSRVGGAHV